MTEEKLKELLDSMTLEEKIGELWCPMNRVYDINGVLTGNDVKQSFTPEQIHISGSTLNLFGFDKLRKVQDEHIKNNPKHIPLLFMADIIHGFATVFPQPLAQSCSFNPELMKRACQVVAKESSLSGINITYFPMIDISRDPRWGRVVESCGEDPYLAYTMCKAIVEGFQGDDLSKPDTIGACVKHFAGYGGAEGGRDYNTVELSELTMRNVYLQGYKGGVDANCAMIMTSYNTIGGIPSTINKWLYRDILRNEWGWDRPVITDLFSMSLMSSDGIGDENDDTGAYYAKKSIENGIDIEMGGHLYGDHLARLVREGKVDEKYIDESCMRSLKLKNDLGLFENPYRFMDEEKAKAACKCKEHLEVARELSEQSCVLLKNDDKIFPITEKSGKVAFIGPFMNFDKLNGAWQLVHNDANQDTLVTEINRQYPDNNYIFANGCAPLGREQKRESMSVGYDDYKANKTSKPLYCDSITKIYPICDEENRERDIAAAVEIAKTVDTVVLTLGETPNQFGEAHSRANIRIPDIQLELFNRVYEVNKNVAVILFNGRPLDITDINDKAKGILDVWYLGTKMTEAVVNLVFGKAVPSGKLTMCFPNTANQIPSYYNHLRTDHRQEPYWSEYIDDVLSTPLYTFGHGLSYTEFKYGDTLFDSVDLHRGGKITASCEVTNIGGRDAVEVVQLYIQDCYAKISRPVMELKGFKRVFIKAGETVKVEFEITEPMLRYWNDEIEYASDNGMFKAKIATSSNFTEGKDMYAFYLKD